MPISHLDLYKIVQNPTIILNYKKNRIYRWVIAPFCTDRPPTGGTFLLFTEAFLQFAETFLFFTKTFRFLGQAFLLFTETFLFLVGTLLLFTETFLHFTGTVLSFDETFLFF